MHRLPATDALPGRLILTRGQPSDYFELERFHYLPTAPRTWQQVWVVRYEEGQGARGQGQVKNAPARPAPLRSSVSTLAPRPLPLAPSPRLVAVAVLSWPVPTILARDRYFGMCGLPYGRRLRFANDHIRTISRVVVHPQFRSLGLAGTLIDCLCKHCPTRYVEAIAMMGRAHPMFEQAGMKRVGPDEDPSRPVLLHPGSIPHHFKKEKEPWLSKHPSFPA